MMPRDALPVRMGEIRVVDGTGVLSAVGLGSCVAVVMHDAEAGVVGLAHVLLPDPSAGRDAPPGRFASSAVPALLEAMEASGARRERLRAKITGGASMFRGLSPDGVGATGRRNVAAARDALARLEIPLVGEDVGGSWGRTVHVDAVSGRLVVTNVLRDDVVL